MFDMEINKVDNEKYVLFNIKGSLSNEQLNGVKASIQEVIDNDKRHIFLDLKDVTFICSSALSMLFHFMNEAKKDNRQFLVCSLREDIQKLFIITGVDRHLVLCSDVEEAESMIS